MLTYTKPTKSASPILSLRKLRRHAGEFGFLVIKSRTRRDCYSVARVELEESTLNDIAELIDAFSEVKQRHLRGEPSIFSEREELEFLIEDATEKLAALEAA